MNDELTYAIKYYSLLHLSRQISVHLSYFLIQLLAAATEHLQWFLPNSICNLEGLEAVVEIPLYDAALREQTCFRKGSLSSNSLLERVASVFDQKLEDIYASHCCRIVKRAPTVSIPHLDIGLAGEDGPGQIE